MEQEKEFNNLTDTSRTETEFLPTNRNIATIQLTVQLNDVG